MRRIAATSRPERSATSRTERVAPRLRTRSAASPSTCWSPANASIWSAVAPCATSHARSAASCFSTGPPASSIDTHATAAGGPRVAGDRSARRAQRLDQLALVHGRPAGDAEVAGPLHQVVLGPVVVGRLLGTLALGTLAGVEMRAALPVLMPDARIFSYWRGFLTLEPWLRPRGIVTTSRCRFHRDTYPQRPAGTRATARHGAGRRSGEGGI